MKAGSLQSISAKIRTDLQGTGLSGRVTYEAWRYAWMNGLRVNVSKALNLAPADKVLDVGCGDGWFSLQNALRYPKVRFTGIDLYEAKEAREISQLIGTANCRFYTKDALRMNIGGRFDCVVLFMALGNICETASSIKRLLANCRSLMKRDAKLLIVEPFQEDFPKETRDVLLRMYRLYKVKGKSRGEDRETVQNRESTLRILRGSGFRILEVLNRKFRWYIRRDAVMRYFGLERLPMSLPDRFWVFDRPKQVTIILAERAS